jgi:hypothetical protein
MSHGADPRELFQRFEGNPILGRHDFPKMVNAVFNPGATVIDGRTLLLLRVEHRTGLSSLLAATSEDGLTGREIDPVRGLQQGRTISRSIGGSRTRGSPAWVTSTTLSGTPPLGTCTAMPSSTSHA